MSFGSTTVGGLECLVFKPWLEAGIVHGFTVKPADFGGTGAQEWGAKLRAGCGADSLLLLEQVHGVDCVPVTPQLAERASGEPVQKGDGWIVSGRLNRTCVVGVKAADCVPILCVAGDARILIHAGWRGLANGVIPRALEGAPIGSPLECVIGPCAGPDGYEVGPEVAEAIGPVWCGRPSSDDRLLLDLAGTAQAIIGGIRPDAQVSVARVNTVLDRRFHSFRRDGGDSGRNLGFFLVG